MRPRHLLAASAVTLGLLLVPATADASETGCGEADLLEVVTPESRDGATTQRMLHGDTVAAVDVDHENARISWRTHDGIVVERLLVQAGRREFTIDTPSGEVTVDSAREITRVTFCGHRPDRPVQDTADGTVELAPATLVVLAEAVVIEREPTPTPAAPIEAVPTPAAPIEAAPIEAAPIEAAPIEAASIQAATVEAAPPPSGIDRPTVLTTREPAGGAMAQPEPVLALAAAESVTSGPVPLPVGTLEFVVLTCLGMVTFSATARTHSGRRRGH